MQILQHENIVYGLYINNPPERMYWQLEIGMATWDRGVIYRTEGNFGGGKIWRIKQNITVGEIKFSELLAKRTPCLINYITNCCV